MRQMSRRLIAPIAFAGLAFASPAVAADGVAIVAPADRALVAGTVRISAATPAQTSSVEFAWSPDGTAWSVIAVDSEDAGDVISLGDLGAHEHDLLLRPREAPELLQRRR